MIYQSDSLTVTRLDGDVAELNFDLKGESVNKFNRLTMQELKAAADELAADSSLKGLLVTSAKDVFIVGADITEFGESFALPDAELLDWCAQSNAVFSVVIKFFEEDISPSTATVPSLRSKPFHCVLGIRYLYVVPLGPL